MNILKGSFDAVDMREAMRYLGYIPGADAGAAAPLLKKCEREVLAVQDLKAVYAPFSVTRGEELDLGFAKTDSRDLKNYLSGCDGLILFAATAGAGIDRLILRYNRTSPSAAAVVQALGAALVEQWCDHIHSMFVREYGAKTARFSCGFGDLPLTLQRDIFRALDVEKNIGVTLSDDCFMTPAKSVTAIAGIQNDIQAKT